MVELVVPLAITVLVVQNGQGIAILTAAGHTPRSTRSPPHAAPGRSSPRSSAPSRPASPGPVNAIISATGGKAPAVHRRRRRRPPRARIRPPSPLFDAAHARHSSRLSSPPRRAGDAARAADGVHRVLPGRFTLGALVTFLVTVAAIPIFGIGAPFWGLVAGTAASLFLDRADWRAARTCPSPRKRGEGQGEGRRHTPTLSRRRPGPRSLRNTGGARGPAVQGQAEDA